MSVITPCFNHGAYLRDAIDSLRDCPVELYELIVVNDGSDDPSTLEVLEQLESEDIRVLHQPNRGLAAARNAGVAASRGRYILPLDSDNRVRARYLTVGVEVLDREPETGVAYGDSQYFGQRSGVGQSARSTLNAS